jgi:hypothetical protein
VTADGGVCPGGLISDCDASSSESDESYSTREVILDFRGLALFFSVFVFVFLSLGVVEERDNGEKGSRVVIC